MERRAVLSVLLAAASARAVRAELADVQARGALRVLVWVDNLPELFAVTPGRESGFEQEVLRGFCDRNRLRLEVVPVPTLDGRVPALLRGDGDVIAGGFVDTETRRKLVSFTSELFPIRHVAVTRKPRPALATVEALRLERVGTIRGSSWADEVKAAGVPVANVDDRFTSAASLLDGLKKGKVSAAVFSAVWGVVAQRDDPELQLGLLLGAPTSVGFAVRKGEPKLLAALDEYVRNVRMGATWSRLVVRWFGEAGLDILRRSRTR